MGLVRKIKTTSAIYRILGRFLLLTGVALGIFLLIQLLRDVLDDSVAKQSEYLLIASTPMFELPVATPLPTFTPTLVPPPKPAIRISIPAIGLNSVIEEVSSIEISSPANEIVTQWDTVAFAVGHYDTSANPGGNGNIVFSGHNNTLGEVFRYLDQLVPGDELILFTETGEFHYVVQKKYIIPFLGNETEGNAALQAYAAPQSTEMVTLISCWPYTTNTNRIIIVAVPATDGS